MLDFCRKILFEALRGYQSLFVEARERAVKAIAFAKILRKDLEVSAEFGVKGDPMDVYERLQETRHVKVLAPNCDLQIFVPACISKHQESVLQLLDMHCGQTTGAINKDKGRYIVTILNESPDVYLSQATSCWSIPMLSQRNISGGAKQFPSD